MRTKIEKKIRIYLYCSFISVLYFSSTYIFHINQYKQILDKNEDVLTFSGTSGTPVVSPNVTEVEVGKYLMEWTTPSFAEIVEHALVYKQVKVKVSSSILYSSVSL